MRRAARKRRRRCGTSQAMTSPDSPSPAIAPLVALVRNDAAGGQVLIQAGDGTSSSGGAGGAVSVVAGSSGVQVTGVQAATGNSEKILPTALITYSTSKNL